jgi:hypothetical protein
MIQWFKALFKKEPTLRFACCNGGYYVSTPPVEARKEIPYWIKPQIKNKNVKFAKCPGMFDLAQAGYLIRAHVDMHIKVNKQGLICKFSGVKTPETMLEDMSYDLVDGLSKPSDKVPHKVYKLPLPWAVFAKKGYSALVQPATMHSPFLDKLYVYPGIVDYDNFTSINFIFSPLVEGEFVIDAGTPLLQVLPYRREDFTATVSKATEEEHDKHYFTFYSRTVKGLYRKMFHAKKSYRIIEK